MRLVIRDLIPIIILIIILFTILRSLYNKKNNINYSLKDLYYLFYIVYFISLFHLVTKDKLLNFKPEINIKLFKEIFRYSIGSSLFYKNIFGNIIIFIPFGMLIKHEFNLKLLKVIIISLIFSLSIETVQLIIGRVFDIDDILLNIIGSVIGYIVIKCVLLFLNKI